MKLQHKNINTTNIKKKNNKMNEQIECVTKILTSIENIETLIHSNEVPLGEHVQEAM